MTTSQQAKIVQYLDEAHAIEVALVRVLQEQIAVTPRGRYRSALEQHLRETRSHADRIGERRGALDGATGPIGAIVGFAQDAVGQALALAKAPLDLVRGSGGEEKVLKNAKDACATEALEIATYMALEELARQVGDDRTAQLAAAIRKDEEAMLERIEQELPALARAVVAADVAGRGAYDITETGAADAVRETLDEAGEPDLPIDGYDSLNADEIVKRLPELSQIDLATVDAHERKQVGRRTILDRTASLRGDEPWPGYDDMNAPEIVERLRDADADLAARARDHERAHKARATVLRAVERELAHA